MNHYVHNLDPILVSLGPVAIRWYGFMYLVGFTAAFIVLRRKYRQGMWALNSIQTQDLITYLLAGMLVGARTIYVLVYNPEIMKESFWNLFAVWQGGLSYHGAALGFAAAMCIYSRRHKVGFLHLADYVTMGAALGVFFGRIGNFINGELWGRVTDVPWGVIFSNTGGGPLPRHPSQIYQGLCEGLFVFLAILIIEKREKRKGEAPNLEENKKPILVWQRTGIMASSYVILYGVARFVIEFFRQPDPQLGFYFGWMTMGQILCTLMVLIGATVLSWRIKRPIAIEYPRPD